MPFAADRFIELCSDPPVCAKVETVETERRAALKKFWVRLALGIAISIGAFVFLLSAGWETTGFIILAVGLLFAFIAAFVPVGAVSDGLKHTALSRLAEMAGMEFIPADFDPPAYRSTRALLFGDVSSETFSDLFHGTDTKGRGYAIYEAELQRRAGRHSYVLFSGQVYAFQHEGAENAYTVLRPDRRMFNFFRPARDMARVSFPSNEEFERKLEVYSTDDGAARRIFADPELQQRLLEMRRHGRLFACITPTEALFAIGGKNRFEPGSMFRRLGGTDRVRLMYEDFCQSGLLSDFFRSKLP